MVKVLVLFIWGFLVFLVIFIDSCEFLYIVDDVDGVDVKVDGDGDFVWGVDLFGFIVDEFVEGVVDVYVVFVYDGFGVNDEVVGVVDFFDFFVSLVILVIINVMMMIMIINNISWCI